jgi:hypothetical protein
LIWGEYSLDVAVVLWLAACCFFLLMHLSSRFSLQIEKKSTAHVFRHILVSHFSCAFYLEWRQAFWRGGVGKGDGGRAALLQCPDTSPLGKEAFDFGHAVSLSDPWALF